MTSQTSTKPRPIVEMSLEEVLASYESRDYFNKSPLKEETIEKRLIERGLQVAKTKSDLNRLLQVVLRAHEAQELQPRIFAQIMPIMRRVEQLPRRQRRLADF